MNETAVALACTTERHSYCIVITLMLGDKLKIKINEYILKKYALQQLVFGV